MSLKTVISFTGVIGSGKDYQANLLIEQGFQKYCLADPVREVVWDLIGWRPSTPEDYDQFKVSKLTTVMEYKNSVIENQNIKFIESNTWTGTETTGRDLLILVGDGFRKRFGEQIWINQLISRIKNSDHDRIVIPDCRYANELDRLDHTFPKFKAIFCNYKSNRYTVLRNKPSEELAVNLLDEGFLNLDHIESYIWRKWL
jgi:hypothetical protein